MGRKKRPETAIPQSAPQTAPFAQGGRCIEVCHPVYGTYTAEGVKDKLQAVQKAAKAWGGLQWSKIARECEFRETTPQSPAATAPLTRGAEKRR